MKNQESIQKTGMVSAKIGETITVRRATPMEKHLAKMPGVFARKSTRLQWLKEYEHIRDKAEKNAIEEIPVSMREYQRFVRNMMKAPKLSGLSNTQFYQYLKKFMLEFEKLIDKGEL